MYIRTYFRMYFRLIDYIGETTVYTNYWCVSDVSSFAASSAEGASSADAGEAPLATAAPLVAVG